LSESIGSDADGVLNIILRSMDTIIIVWIVVIIAIQIFSLIKSKNSDWFNTLRVSLKDDLHTFKDEISERINDKFEKLFKENKENETTLRTSIETTVSKFLKDALEKIAMTLDSMKLSLSQKFDDLNTTTKNQLDSISKRVDERLESGFKKTEETFKNLLEKMVKIDEAQKNLDKISVEITQLQNVLSNNKTRWIFGEIQLEHIMSKVFGESSGLYETQYKMKDGTLADFVVKTEQGLIPIDAKFSLSYYERMYNEELSEEERKQAKKDFKTALKRQIDETTKYIQPIDTIESAFMFVPAEAIFAEVYAYHRDVIEYGYTKGINIVWPATIMAMLSIIFLSIKSQETQKNAIQIKWYLKWLWDEFKRFRGRWDDFTKHYEKVTQDLGKIDTTAKKIINKFDWIQELRFEEIEALPNHSEDIR